jgi:hypothetical protein
MIVRSQADSLDPSSVAHLVWIGVVLLVLATVCGMLAGLSKRVIFFLYLFICGVAPVVAALGLVASANPSRILGATVAHLSVAAKALVFFLLASALGMAARMYLIAPNPLHERTPLRLAMLSALAAVAVAALVFAGSMLRRSQCPRFRRIGEFSERLTKPWWPVDALAAGMLAAVCIVYSPFVATNRFPSSILEYAHATPHFSWWVAIGIACMLATYCLRRVEGAIAAEKKVWLDRVALGVVLVFVLMLFDASLYLDLGHYMPYVGPALHAKHGGVPMVDVFSQYGLLPWVLIEGVYGFLPTTFGSAAVLTRAVNLAYLFSIVLIIFALSQRRLSALLFAIPVLIVGITFHDGNYNMNSLPSTTGMRYLVPALMVLALTVVRQEAHAILVSVPILVIASFWSLETFVFTFAPWISVALIQCLRHRTFRGAGRSALLGIAAVGIAHLLAGVVALVSTGEWIRYRPYLGFFTRFRPDEIRDWAVPFNPAFALWIPVWLAFFVVVASSTYNAVRRAAVPEIADRLLPAATFGIASLAYFVGRTSPTTLGLSLLPFAIVMVIASERILPEHRRLGARGLVASLALVAMGICMVAFGGERFAREPLPEQGNSTLLRNCLSAAGCDFKGVSEQLAIKVRALPFAEQSPAIQAQQPRNHEREQVREIVSQLRRYAADKARVGILGPMNSYGGYMGISALMETGQWYLWGISSPHNDELSPGVIELILKAAARTADGEVIVVATAAELPFLEQEILRTIGKRCQLEHLEQGRFYRAVRTRLCAQS